MRQIQMDGVGRMRMVEREIPPLSPTQVLVKVEACGLCTWERYIYAGTESMPFPFVGGHEIAGRVVEAGSAAGDIPLGTGAAIAKWVRCNRCEPCRRGYDNHCEGNDRPNDRGYSGPAGFADYLVCESYEVFPFRGELVHAALAEPLACVTRAVNRLDVVNGDTVAVVGAGMMGLLFLKLLRLRGCDVVMIQRSEKRRAVAQSLGAVVLSPQEDWPARIREMTGTGAAAAVYTAGGSGEMNRCLGAVRAGGVVMQYAPTHEERPSVDLDLVHFKEIRLTGAIRHDKESFRQAVRTLETLDLTGINLVYGSFENMEAEMKRAAQDRDIHRILLQWEEKA